MKNHMKSSLTVGALAIAVLAGAQIASAQAQRASDKARGYYGPAASPEPADTTWLAPGVTGELMTGEPTGPMRRFSYAPAPATRTAQPAAPQAQSMRPAPQAMAPAPAASAPTRRYSYSYQPQYYRGWRMDRVLTGNPANRDAAAKAQGEY
jgi:long-subunit fatty acid transport protein